MFLLKLILAHIIADFFLQPKDWVISKRENKIKSIPLIYHALLHGFLSYFILADWKNFTLPLLIILIHWSIDLFKVYRKKTFIWFLIDQMLHLSSLVIIWGIYYGSFYEIGHYLVAFINNKMNLWVMIGYLLILNPTSFFIDLATKSWQKDLKKQDKGMGLKNAGQWIGFLERILILTFIFENQFAAIGFLIAAKSIFRFGDLTKNHERKLTEYILIGTFLSFTTTLLVGLFILKQIN